MTPESRIQNSEARMAAAERPAAKNFQQLIVWQKAHQFVLGVYQLTEGFPRKETFGLTSQLRRSAISIPANTAEGFQKRGRADKGRYLNIAQGSLEECRYFLILAKDLHYGDVSQLYNQLEEVSKMLESYSTKILTSGF
jgi:four helix bundle protein